jgi:hypothetical protein
MNIDQLKTELREFIKLSETITPGTWKASPNYLIGGWWVQTPFNEVAETSTADFCNERDATFISRSRNISPTMAKMLLVAVEGLERLYDDTEGYADGAPDASGHDRLCNEVSHSAKHQLQQLLKLWEETK